MGAASAHRHEGAPSDGHSHGRSDAGHDHPVVAMSREEIEQGLAAADLVCAQRRTRLTASRRLVLSLILGSSEPPTAYALLDRLREAGLNAAPPTVYRALDFLMENGLVHRVESRSAYIACTAPHQTHAFQHLICRCCGVVMEMVDPSITQAITSASAELRFKAERQTVEVFGLCQNCVPV
jgi:Fur family zinc uptake transcriptional regulator